MPNFFNKNNVLVGGLGVAAGVGTAIAANNLKTKESEATEESTSAKPFISQLSFNSRLPPYIIEEPASFRPGSQPRYFDTRLQRYIPSPFPYFDFKTKQLVPGTMISEPLYDVKDEFKEQPAIPPEIIFTSYSAATTANICTIYSTALAGACVSAEASNYSKPTVGVCVACTNAIIYSTALATTSTTPTKICTIYSTALVSPDPTTTNICTSAQIIVRSTCVCTITAISKPIEF